MSAAELWARLRAANIVQNDMPPQNETGETTSWSVRILLGIAGWIAALFLFGFFMLLFNDLYNSTAAMLGLGVLLCAIAAALFRQRQQEFTQQFTLAVALAGQLLVWMGMFKLFDYRNDMQASLAMGIFEVALLWLLPNYLHRILATLAAGCFFYKAAMSWGYPFAFDVLLAMLFSLFWLKETYWLARVRWSEPVGIALALLLVGTSASFMRFHLYLYRYEGSTQLLVWTSWAAKILIAVIFVWSMAQLLRQAGTALRSRTGLAALAGSILLAVLCMRAPGMLPALLLLFIAFGRGHRFMTLLGLIAVVGYGMHYYYILDYTLLFKSGVLGVMGLALLSARLWMRRLGAQHA